MVEGQGRPEQVVVDQRSSMHQSVVGGGGGSGGLMVVKSLKMQHTHREIVTQSCPEA